MLNPEVRPARAFDVNTSIIADNLFLVRDTHAFELKEVEALIWQSCDGVATARDIAGKLSERYSVPNQDVLDDTLEFLDQLLNERLIEV